MDKCELFAKSWTEQSAIYKQKSKRQLKRHLRKMSYLMEDWHYLNVRKCLYDICADCIRNDDVSCLDSVLSYSMKHHTRVSKMKFMNDYGGLWYLSMKESTECFEYLVSITMDINEQLLTIRKDDYQENEVTIDSGANGMIYITKNNYPHTLNTLTCYPVLHIACINCEDSAVGVLLKNRANVNVMDYGTGNNALHQSMCMRLHYKFNECHYRDKLMVVSCDRIMWKLNLLDRIIQMLLLAGANTNVERNYTMMECDGRTEMFSLSRVINETVGSFTENCY